MAHYLVVAAMVWDIAYSKRKWLRQQLAGWGRARVWKKHPDTLHRKVLIRERWQADEDTDADIVAPLPHGAGGSWERTGERPWGIMLAKPREGQQQAKGGGPGTSSQTHVGTQRAQAHTGHGTQPPSKIGLLMPLPDRRQ